MPWTTYTTGTTTASTVAYPYYTWSNQGTSTASTSTYYRIVLPYAYDSNTYGQTVASTDTVWRQWAEDVELTQEERERRRAADEQAQREYQAQSAHREEMQRQLAAKRVEAEAKADRLLQSVLSEEQWATYKRERQVFVRSQTGRRYKIKKGWAGNVEEIDLTGRSIRRFCIHPAQHVPDADNMVAQIAMLRFDEDRFLRTANKTELLAAA